ILSLKPFNIPIKSQLKTIDKVYCFNLKYVINTSP
ncbi:unnamed protein product, partial [marine sediment metagenome]